MRAKSSDFFHQHGKEGIVLGVYPLLDKWRNPSLDHSIDKWKMQRRFLLQKVMCKQEWLSSKAEGSILHIHPFSCCFGLFYQQRGKKLMLIKSADDPKIEGAEISRKAGP